MNDKKLLEIPELKWLPWIGQKYFDANHENKFLIVGESHYHDNTEDSIRKHNLQSFTRIVIEEIAIQRNYHRTKIFKNFHKALFRNDKFDSRVFWNLVSYYNFIQTPMKTNKSRPNNKDFLNSWSTFFELIKILQPKTCIFIGTSAASTVNRAVEKSDYFTDGLITEERINRAYPKTLKLKSKDGNEIHLIFIRHTSQMFSWNKWNLYLQKKINEELTWFDEQLKIKQSNEHKHSH